MNKEILLLEPTAKYVTRIENSRNYLNCPKFMFNSDLNDMYRQGCHNDKSITYIADYLKHYGYAEPLKTAQKLKECYDNIKLADFHVANVNKYIDKTPAHIEAKHKNICAWIEKHTTYYSAVYGGGVNHIPSYPFQY